MKTKQYIADLAKQRVDDMLQQYVEAAMRLRAQGVSESRHARLRASYAEALAVIWETDCSFARLVQESDMLIRYSGLQADEKWRPMSLFSSVFSRATKSIGGIAAELMRAETGDVDDARQSQHGVDIGLTDVVHGSLVLGMVARPVPDASKALPERVTRAAMTALANAMTIAVSQGPEAVEAAFDDAGLADAALSGIGILMSRRQDDRFLSVGVCSTADFYGAESLPTLDRAGAERVHEYAHRPVDGSVETLSGVCRATDFDSKRLALRLDPADGGHRVRVVIPKNLEATEDAMRAWLNAGRIEVVGQVSLNKAGRPSLVRVQATPRIIK